MKSKNTIAVIVVIQIITISLSFGILLNIQIQEENIVDYVNIAGKNRMYTALTLNELNSFSTGSTSYEEVNKILNEFEINIMLLKNGGSFLEHKIRPIPDKYTNDLRLVEERFIQFKNLANDLKELKNSGEEPSEIFYAKRDKIENELFAASNALTLNLNTSFIEISKLISILQISLPIINAIVYISTVFIMFKILKKESNRIQKLEKLSTIGTMSSRLAHDLKNPLTVVKNISDLLSKQLEPSMDKEMEKRCKLLKNSVTEMNRIIEDVLDFARTKDLHLEMNSINTMLQNAKKNITTPNKISVELPENDFSIKCDSKKLEAVFSNLFINAIQAIDSNGKISIRCKEDLDKMYIEFEDSGHGIHKNDLSKIFEPLFSSKTTGTGLGLSICKNIIEQHGGKISVKINPTLFTIELPKHR